MTWISTMGRQEQIPRLISFCFTVALNVFLLILDREPGPQAWRQTLQAD